MFTCRYSSTIKRQIPSRHYSVMQSHHNRLALTRAGLHAIGPRVIDTLAATSSAVLEPSSTRSATTDSAGFPECAALWTSCDTMDRGGVRWRADRLSGYEFSLGYRLMRS